MYRPLADIACGKLPGVWEPILPRDLPSRYSRAAWHHSQFVLEQQLYEGPCSSVHRVRDSVSGERLCLKVYRKSHMSPVQQHQMTREAELHCRLKHPNILRFIAAWGDITHFFLLLEFAPSGDLYKSLHTHGSRLSERAVVGFVLQPLLSSLSYLHGEGIIHRDLKPENIVFAKEGGKTFLRLADFGLSIDQRTDCPRARTGTLDYMAPEVVRCPLSAELEEGSALPRYDEKVDIWSLGALLYELFVGAPPFEDDDQDATVNGILHSDPGLPDYISSDAANFIGWCLEKDPRHRPSALELMKHDWLRARTTASERFAACHIHDMHQAGVLSEPAGLGPRSVAAIHLHPKTYIYGQTGSGIRPVDESVGHAQSKTTDFSQYSSLSSLSVSACAPVRTTQHNSLPHQRDSSSFDVDSAREYTELRDKLVNPIKRQPDVRKGHPGKCQPDAEMKNSTSGSYMSLAEILQQKCNR
mmetsp:Transcript_18818/g.52475  ORF Transcript_18818/g.52475 Transcript_18818/m.52475 type:complete len:471 (+) Transcript_18818:234-1646(+)|eukprot:CAMPEP_0117674802 /NCGR_PEP_ID=MMETSP0804-20121206/15245_1 /TAXON_ID=1074897 /ORGANISM="Tetraselmis astigmatica, Strain CCMP880" /LENGTH=470 /DNA_ID=CAMNT_0005483721 /DNA_START=161 /DNA_END=1573 /DNA_ORIENTATION=+